MVIYHHIKIPLQRVHASIYKNNTSEFFRKELMLCPERHNNFTTDNFQAWPKFSCVVTKILSKIIKNEIVSLRKLYESKCRNLSNILASEHSIIMNTFYSFCTLISNYSCIITFVHTNSQFYQHKNKGRPFCVKNTCFQPFSRTYLSTAYFLFLFLNYINNYAKVSLNTYWLSFN